jgi:hypothetical protein
MIKALAVAWAFAIGPAVVIASLGWHAWLLVVPAGVVSATIVVLLGAWARRRRNACVRRNDAP